VKIYSVVSDGEGNIFEIPTLHLAGMSGGRSVVLHPEDLIPLPHGSDLFELPGRVTIGVSPRTGQFRAMRKFRGRKIVPVAAFLAPAYLQLFRCAYQTDPGMPVLPLFSYTAVGWAENQFYAAGQRIDPDKRQDLRLFQQDQIDRKAGEMKRRFPKNRLVQHLVDNCVCRYGCPAARNFVLERWECPLPTSPGCNAHCLGCLSKQPTESGVVSPMERISFIPEAREIIELAVAHIEKSTETRR